jgi:hypothetical protein
MHRWACALRRAAHLLQPQYIHAGCFVNSMPRGIGHLILNALVVVRNGALPKLLVHSLACHNRWQPRHSDVTEIAFIKDEQD